MRILEVAGVWAEAIALSALLWVELREYKRTAAERKRPAALTRFAAATNQITVQLDREVAELNARINGSTVASRRVNPGE